MIGPGAIVAHGLCGIAPQENRAGVRYLLKKPFRILRHDLKVFRRNLVRRRNRFVEVLNKHAVAVLDAFLHLINNFSRIRNQNRRAARVLRGDDAVVGEEKYSGNAAHQEECGSRQEFSIHRSHYFYRLGLLQRSGFIGRRYLSFGPCSQFHSNSTSAALHKLLPLLQR